VPGAKTVRGYSFFGDSFVYILSPQINAILSFRDGTLNIRSCSQLGPCAPPFILVSPVLESGEHFGRNLSLHRVRRCDESLEWNLWLAANQNTAEECIQKHENPQTELACPFA